mmetsp:Transcript_100041/g.174478  ORF Transcript_100041/g.174478 Transcript_100041/m.174478 type:complete len:158 (+) Transcript_100041:3-476(+)
MQSFSMPINKGGKKKGECKGFAFVTFETRQGMKKALRLNGTLFDGKPLIVKRKDEHQSSNPGDIQPDVEATTKEFEVFVGGLYSIARKAIRKHFAECGEILSFEMPLTSKGESKGIAFIAYKTEQGMKNALELHDTALGKRWLTVEKKVSKSAMDDE